MEINMNRVFKDTEHGRIISMWDLLEKFNDSDTESKFGEYVANCQTYKGGTLEEIRDYAIRKGFARFAVLRCGACNYDGYYCKDWRELKEFDTIEEATQYIDCCFYLPD